MREWMKDRQAPMTTGAYADLARYLADGGFPQRSAASVLKRWGRHNPGKRENVPIGEWADLASLLAARGFPKRAAATAVMRRWSQVRPALGGQWREGELQVMRHAMAGRSPKSMGRGDWARLASLLAARGFPGRSGRAVCDLWRKETQTKTKTDWVSFHQRVSPGQAPHVTLRHEFAGAGHDGGARQAETRDSKNPRLQAHAPPSRIPRWPLQDCKPLTGLALLRFSIADKQAADCFTAPRYTPHSTEVHHRRAGASSSATIELACAEAVAIRGAPNTAHRRSAVPRDVPLNMACDEGGRRDSCDRTRAYCARREICSVRACLRLQLMWQWCRTDSDLVNKPHLSLRALITRPGSARPATAAHAPRIADATPAAAVAASA